MTRTFGSSYSYWVMIAEREGVSYTLNDTTRADLRAGCGGKRCRSETARNVRFVYARIDTNSRSLKHSSKARSYFSLNAARLTPIRGVIVRLRGVRRQLALGSRFPRVPVPSKKRTCRLQSSAESGYAANPRGWNACKYTLQSQPARLSPAARPLLSLTVDGNLSPASLAGLPEFQQAQSR